MINLVTGLLFFIGAPDQYIPNTSFWFKMLFMIVAGVNVLAFEMMWRSRTPAIGPEVHTPAAFKTIGAVSLVSWLMVMFWGRMLPFLGSAF